MSAPKVVKQKKSEDWVCGTPMFRVWEDEGDQQKEKEQPVT